jgi:histidinol-phosphate/aromatic aminotransferase/cobyric acid decarboxylase-like protein
MLPEHKNLVVLRTFSKAMSMAGLRFGYMMAHPEIAREVYKSKLPYNVNIFHARGAEIVIEKRSALNRAIEALVRERDRVYGELLKRKAVRAFPSTANFILMRTGKPARELFRSALQSRRACPRRERLSAARSLPASFDRKIPKRTTSSLQRWTALWRKTDGSAKSDQVSKDE